MISWIQGNVKKAMAVAVAFGAAVGEILQQVAEWLLG